MTAVVSAVLLAAAVALALGPAPGRHADALHRLAGRAAGDRPSGERGPDRGWSRPEQDLVERNRTGVAVLAALAPVLLVGGLVGALGGVVVGVVVHRVLGRREPAAARRRREAVARDLPQVVDLLGVALAAGAAPVTALVSVASAVDGPVAEELRTVHRSLSLGRDPVRVWTEAAGRPGLAALARTMARAVESGASVTEALHRLAEDLRSAARAEAETRARTVGVRAAAPLGLCLLPAFVMVGVVPLVAGTVGSLLAR